MAVPGFLRMHVGRGWIDPFSIWVMTRLNMGRYDNWRVLCRIDRYWELRDANRCRRH
jgi:hypothetical protein